jgi:hypothetical protein
VLCRYNDGSYLSRLGTVQMRVVECQITIATGAGRHAGSYRLATTLLDHCQHPAAALVTLYHQRWEIETAYLELGCPDPSGLRILIGFSPERTGSSGREVPEVHS